MTLGKKLDVERRRFRARHRFGQKAREFFRIKFRGDDLRVFHLSHSFQSVSVFTVILYFFFVQMRVSFLLQQLIQFNYLYSLLYVHVHSIGIEERDVQWLWRAVRRTQKPAWTLGFPWTDQGEAKIIYQFERF